MAYPSNSTESVAEDQIRAFVERIERMDEELRAINDDKKEIYAEAKANGFDVKALKIVVQKRRVDRAERIELEALVDLYMNALGETGTPLARVHAHEDDQSGAGGLRRGNDARENRGADLPEPSRPDDQPAVALAPEATEAAQSGDIADQRGEKPLPISATQNALALRPYCLHADDLSKCGGQGRKHCYTCQKAHADEAGEAA